MTSTRAHPLFKIFCNFSVSLRLWKEGLSYAWRDWVRILEAILPTEKSNLKWNVPILGLCLIWDIMGLIGCSSLISAYPSCTGNFLPLCQFRLPLYRREGHQSRKHREGSSRVSRETAWIRKQHWVKGTFMKPQRKHWGSLSSDLISKHAGFCLLPSELFLGPPRMTV